MRTYSLCHENPPLATNTKDSSILACPENEWFRDPRLRIPRCRRQRLQRISGIVFNAGDGRDSFWDLFDPLKQGQDTNHEHYGSDFKRSIMK